MNIFSALITWSDISAVPAYVRIPVLLCALLLVAAYILRSWLVACWRVKKQPISAEYKPPLSLNPAEVSLLYSGNASQKEFAGLVVHMAQRGIVHFRKHKGVKIVLPGPRHVDHLTYYEKRILQAVTEFRNVSAQNLVEHHHTMFTGGTVYKTFGAQVLHTLRSRSYVRSNATTQRWIDVFKTALVYIALLVWLPLTVVALYMMIAAGTGSTDTVVDYVQSMGVYSMYAAPIACIAAVASQRLLAPYSGRRWLMSAKFRKFWPHALGFRQYVVLLEQDKLQFEDPDLKRTANINSLPYAIALGQVDNWRDIVY